MTGFIPIITAGRSGSNHFCDCLGGFNENLSLYEIFQEKETWLPEEQLKYFKKIYERKNDIFKEKINLKKELHNYSHSYPLKFLYDIQASTEREYFSFKIFPHHLRRKHIYGILENCKGLILLKRNPIDMYISLKKAEESGKWSNFDTSKCKIKFDIPKYRQYEKLINEWFMHCSDLAEAYELKVFNINYEDLCLLDFHEQMEFIKNSLNDTFGLKWTLAKNQREERIKQDKSKNYEEKIENFDEFYSFFENQNKTFL
ncbi:MAG: hypothetical protein VX231_10805 [Pseudomonadota bacterium]|nr:hypothetical protein [Pseudomonadota bacterium]